MRAPRGSRIPAEQFFQRADQLAPSGVAPVPLLQALESPLPAMEPDHNRLWSDPDSNMESSTDSNVESDSNFSGTRPPNARRFIKARSGSH